MLNKARALKSGEYPLVVQLIHNRRKKLIYLDYKLHEDEFDTVSEKVLHRKKGRFTQKAVKEMNHTIRAKVRDIAGQIESLSLSNPYFALEDISINSVNRQKCRYLDDYIRQQIDIRLKLDKIGTAEGYKNTLNSLLTFTKNKHIELKGVSYNFLCSYEQFLLSRKVRRNSIAFYMRNLRSNYNRAEKEGLEVAEENPFHKYHIRTEKTIKRALDKEDVKRIAELDLSASPSLDLSRDVFMFSFYSRGMSFVDVAYLSKEDMKSNVVDYRRVKTGQELLIVITSKMWQIIDKYKNSSQYVFPLLTDGTPVELYKQYRAALWMVDRNLKKVAKMAGVNVALTMNTARHSWATAEKDTGAPVSAISDSLGHTSEKTTQIYLRELDMRVLNALNEKVSHL